jgi:hypothetical protein
MHLHIIIETSRVGHWESQEPRVHGDGRLDVPAAITAVKHSVKALVVPPVTHTHSADGSTSIKQTRT